MSASVNVEFDVYVEGVVLVHKMAIPSFVHDCYITYHRTLIKTSKNWLEKEEQTF